MIRWEFVSEMRLNSVSPSLDTSEIMKSIFYCRREGKDGEWKGWGGGGGMGRRRRSVGIEVLMVEEGETHTWPDVAGFRNHNPNMQGTFFHFTSQI